MSQEITASVVIIGGGVAGIAAAHYLEKNNIDYIILEKESSLGGLLRPLNYNGFAFDRAVHLSFAYEKEVREEFDQTEYLTHAPISYNWDQNIWLRHPVQNNLFPLEAEKKIQLIKSLIEARSLNVDINNYKDWLYQSYGEYFSNQYPIKYTRKYWRYEPELLDFDWLGPRMTQADLDLVLEGAMLETKKNTYYVKEMRYPKHGTYFKFIENMAKRVKARCNERVTLVNQNERYLLTSSHLKFHYSHIINTSPLPQFIKSLNQAPSEILLDAQDLEATSVDLISIGMKTLVDFQSLWFYIYDEDIYASRCYSPSLKSCENAPNGQSSIQFEIYSVPSDSRIAIDDMKNNCIYALKKMNICTEKDILFIEHHREDNANVIFKLGASRKAASIVDWLRVNNIYSAGRFGEWKYLWSNQSFMSGVNSAKQIIDGLG